MDKGPTRMGRLFSFGLPAEQEAEVPRAKYKRTAYTPEALQALRARQHEQRESRTRYHDPRQVLTIPQAAALDGVSVPTMNRAIASGAVRTIQVSARRRGIRVGDYWEWQERRIRSGVS